MTPHQKKQIEDLVADVNQLLYEALGPWNPARVDADDYRTAALEAIVDSVLTHAPERAQLRTWTRHRIRWAVGDMLRFRSHAPGPCVDIYSKYVSLSAPERDEDGLMDLDTYEYMGTPLQQRIVRGVRRGRTPKQIAADENISPSTVYVTICQWKKKVRRHYAQA